MTVVKRPFQLGALLLCVLLAGIAARAGELIDAEPGADGGDGRARPAGKPRVVDPRFPRLSDPKPTLREACIKKLGSEGKTSVQAAPAVLAMLEDEDAGVRLAAAHFFLFSPMRLDRHVSRERIFAGLCARVSGDTDDRVRAACARAVFQRGARPPALPADTQESAAKVMAAAMSAPESGVRAGAVLALGILGEAGRRRTGLVVKACADADPNVRSMALASLIRLKPERELLLGAARKALADKSAGVRMDAVRLLEKPAASDPEVVNLLAKALGDEVEAVRSNAAYSLGKLGAKAEPASARLRELRNGEESPRMRLRAGDALYRITGDVNEYLSAAREALKSGNGDAANYAMQLMDSGRCTEKGSVDFLIEALGHSSRDVKLSALGRLSVMGAAAAPALPAVEKLCASKDTTIRISAQRIVKTMRKAAAAGADAEPPPEQF